MASFLDDIVLYLTISVTEDEEVRLQSTERSYLSVSGGD